MSRFQPGQVWHYKTRPGEESSRLTIAKVETHPKLGTIVHIQVTGVSIESPTTPGGLCEVISHLPYAERSVADSVTTLEADTATPTGWEDGYRQWKAAFDEGKAGIWTITVSETVAAMEQMLGKQ